MAALVEDAGVDPGEVEEVLISAATKMHEAGSGRFNAWGTTPDGVCLWMQFNTRGGSLEITSVEVIDCADMP